MKKALGITMYILFLAGFIIWMLNASNVIARLNGYAVVSEVSLEEYQAKKKDDVFCSIYYAESSGGMFENSFIIGWAFVETEQPNSNKYTEMLLVNDKHCYRLPVEQLTDRDKYQNWIKDVQALYPDRKLQNQYLGFISHISGINIQDGTYDIYLYQWENEENYGFTRTNYQIVKAGSNLQLKDEILKSVPAKQIAPVAEAEISVSKVLDGLSAWKTDGLLLSGVILVFDQNCEEQQVYLRLQYDDIDAYYTANSMLRLDISERYDDERYEMCGFVSYITLDEIPSDTMIVTLFAENGGQVYQGRSFILDTSKDDIVVETGFFRSEQLDALPEFPEADKKVTTGLGVTKIAANVLSLNGYIFQEDADSTNQTVYAHLQNSKTDVYYSLLSTARPDVTDAYQNELYGMSGFSGSIILPEDMTQELTVTLLVENNGQIGQGVSYIVDLSGDEAVIKGSYQLSPQLPDAPQNLVADNGQITADLGAAKITDSILALNGYIFRDDMASSEQSVYLHVQSGESDAYYALTPVSRPDIAEAYADERYEMSGFYGAIPISDTSSDELTVITLLAGNDSTTYISRSYLLQWSDDETVGIEPVENLAQPLDAILT